MQRPPSTHETRQSASVRLCTDSARPSQLVLQSNAHHRSTPPTHLVAALHDDLAHPIRHHLPRQTPREWLVARVEGLVAVEGVGAEEGSGAVEDCANSKDANDISTSPTIPAAASASLDAAIPRETSSSPAPR
mmetsp:Transcript_14114/g.35998  ORF Transcript_14114/g.35998 Transcript_14114/m.35998 type:complete len:133 (+) Transcript_14114:880-1278(+)